MGTSKYMLSSMGKYSTDKIEKTAAALSKYDKYIVDERLKMIIVDITDDNLTLLANYLETAAILASESTGNANKDLLDLGFIPVGFMPVDLCEFYIGNIKNALNYHKIPYFELEPSTFLSTRYKNDVAQDIWVSKMDAAKYMGIDPIDVRASEFLREVCKL